MADLVRDYCLYIGHLFGGSVLVMGQLGGTVLQYRGLTARTLGADLRSTDEIVRERNQPGQADVYIDARNFNCWNIRHLY